MPYYGLRDNKEPNKEFTRYCAPYWARCDVLLLWATNQPVAQ